MTNNAVALLVILPMSAGVLTTMLRGRLVLQRCVGLPSLLATITTLLVLVGNAGGSSFAVSQMGDWQAPYGISLVLDGISALLIGTATVVAIAAYVHAMSMLSERLERGWFHPLFHLLLLGVNFSFLTGDLFNLFVAFEIMLMASYALVCLGGGRRQIGQAYKYVVLNLVGSTIFVLGAGLVYGVMGTLNYADLAHMVMEATASSTDDVVLPTGFQALALLLLFVFCVKAAVFPLWFWLPDTYHTMPSSLGAVFAALLSKVGVYAILRLFPMVFAAPGIYESGFLDDLLPVTAGATMLIAIVAAVAAANVRRVVSMILIAHVGYLLFGIALMRDGSFAAVLFYMTQEMLVIAGLFLCCGLMEEHAGSADLRNLGGLARRTPLLGSLFLLLGLAIVGIPPLPGFHGKALLVREGIAAGTLEAWILVGATLATAVLTLLAVLRVWCTAFWSPLKGPALALPSGAEPGPPQRFPSAYAGVCLVVVLAVAYGVLAEPMLQWTMQATAGLSTPVGYVDGVLGPEPLDGPVAAAERGAGP